MARAVLWLERQGAEEEKAVTAAYSMYEEVVVLCLRVHWDRYQQQQQQGKPAGGLLTSGAGAASPGSPAGKGGASGKSPSSSGSAVASSGSTRGSCRHGSRHGRCSPATAAAGPDGAQPPAAGSQEGQAHSWRELLLSLQPYRLLRLVLQEPRRCAREEPGGPWEAPIGTFMAGPGHLLWALALPEELAAALAADPQLAERIGARATGGGAMEVDACVVEVLKQQLPGLPACKAVAALEGRCGLPVVSRAKRQAARERLGRLRALWARVHVLVDVGEVVGVLEGREG